MEISMLYPVEPTVGVVVIVILILVRRVRRIVIDFSTD